ncbi:hypothetical protein B0H17DRAFT_1080725 [Mycena rosella]|uniref:Uncharacterized protein n=1 Tax=Mycena rosella TaxID=1033263 RepID=A0AAD7D2Y8_MYCRO|nr:hypothetical protein B0H17DRAFT_1080725 [Mycena rosella]
MSSEDGQRRRLSMLMLSRSVRAQTPVHVHLPLSRSKHPRSTSSYFIPVRYRYSRKILQYSVLSLNAGLSRASQSPRRGLGRCQCRETRWISETSSLRLLFPSASCCCPQRPALSGPKIQLPSLIAFDTRLGRTRTSLGARDPYHHNPRRHRRTRQSQSGEPQQGRGRTDGAGRGLPRVGDAWWRARRPALPRASRSPPRRCKALRTP